jgi:hypothetical protein
MGLTMDVVIKILRVLTAVIVPVTGVALTLLTVIKVTQDKGKLPEEGRRCLRCGHAGKGGQGWFSYTENIGSARRRPVKQQLISGDKIILGSESYFICDRCAFRYSRNEILQFILMLIPYPIYLYLVVPMFTEKGIFAGFLIETLLAVLSIGGFISALDLYRAVRFGASPLSEARDHVAIQERKKALGKNFSYYTRIKISHLEKQH